MTMDPSFRLATENDADHLLAMMREYYAYDGHAIDPTPGRVALLAFLREPSLGRAWLVCDESMLVGYLVLTLGYSLEYLGRDAFRDEFYLRESHRGRGWGSRALAFAEEEARKLDVRSIHLEVVRQNTGAKEVYRKSGYLDHDHYLMSKWIEPGFRKPGSGSHE
jgi:GNAT superfamily N-acetyltransferase